VPYQDEYELPVMDMARLLDPASSASETGRQTPRSEAKEQDAT